MFVAHRDRQAVDLGLGRIGDLVDVEPLARPPVEIEDVLLAERIVERQHRRRVHDFAEFTRRLAADPLRRRIRVHEFRVRGFQLLQLAQQRVEPGVGDFRVVEDVVAVVVMLDLVTQLARAP